MRRNKWSPKQNIQYAHTSAKVNINPKLTNEFCETRFCMLVLEKEFSPVDSLQARVRSLLTYVSPPRLDDNGAPAAGLLLDLSHAFLGFLVGVVRCTDCNLVLDPSQTIQLNAAFTAKPKRKQ